MFNDHLFLYDHDPSRVDTSSVYENKYCPSVEVQSCVDCINLTYCLKCVTFFLLTLCVRNSGLVVR